MTKYVKLGIGAGITAFVLIFVLIFIGISNQEITLRQGVKAQQDVNKAVFDNTWKIISQQAEVTDEYKEAFKEIYPKLMDSRYGKGDGSLMKWITEANPQFDTRLYMKLMNSIEGQRTIFTNSQKSLIDKQREHTTFISTFPNSLIVGGRGIIEIELITSDKTKEAFKSGKEDDIKLFNKKK